MQSRIEELLQAIIDGKSASELQPAQSRMEQQFIDIITGGHLSGTPQSRAEALLAQIQSGGGGEAVLIEKYVNSNGNYIAKDDNADGYSKVNVEVPNSYTILDEGKVVNGGQLVEQTARVEKITQNGTYGTTLNSSVVVDIPEPTGTISITENGTADVRDYASAEVNVSGGGGEDVEPSLTAEYQEVEYIDFDGNSYVTINSRYVQSGDIFETVMQYITNNTVENAALGTSIAGSSSNPRFEIFFKSNQATVYSASNISRGGLTQISSFGTNSYKEEKSVSLGDKLYAFLEISEFSISNNYLRIGAYGGSARYRNRLFKIKRSIVTSTLGDVSQSSYFDTHRTTYTWYKPCYRKSDNVAGWYDTANDVFYTNEGTGAFVLGPDIN